MKELPVAPGSGEWLTVRLGIPTASMAHKILTPKTMKFSAQARGYAFRLVAEKLMNESFDSIDYIEHVQRGKDLEPQAVGMYEMVENVQTRPSGFLVLDDLSAGATPDRIILGKSACLEVKAPSPWVHLQYLVDGFEESYLLQAQMQAYVGEFEYVDRWSYHPALPPRLEKTYRDDALIANLRDALDQFNQMKAEIERKVRESGFIEEHAQLRTAFDDLKDAYDARET